MSLVKPPLPVLVPSIPLGANQSAPIQIPGATGFTHGGGLTVFVDRPASGIHSPIHRMPVTPPNKITAPSSGMDWTHARFAR